jgi:hypothetical protein
MNVLKILPVLLVLPASAFGEASQPSDAEQAARIAQLPAAECQRDLTKLHDIYGQMKTMTAEQKQQFLQSIVSYIRANNLQKPPPPKPCSTVHLALEERCGNVSDAESKCQGGASE